MDLCIKIFYKLLYFILERGKKPLHNTYIMDSCRNPSWKIRVLLRRMKYAFVFCIIMKCPFVFLSSMSPSIRAHVFVLYFLTSDCVL